MRIVYAFRVSPRPRSLSEAAIAAAALAVLDRHGLAELSMRNVASRLGVGTMSLYRYVSSRSELERLVVDHVLAPVDTAVSARSSWKNRIITLAERIRSAVRVHPAVVPLLMVHRHSSHGVMRCAEGFLGVLTEAGFTGKSRVVALRALVSYLAGALEAQHLGPLDGAGTDSLAMTRGAEYPLLAETARTARAVSPDEEFRGGIGLLLRGLEEMISRRS